MKRDNVYSPKYQSNKCLKSKKNISQGVTGCQGYVEEKGEDLKIKWFTPREKIIISLAYFMTFT
jgi:hypothetical protein